MLENIVGKPTGFVDRDFVRKSGEVPVKEENFADTLRGVLGQVNELQVEANDAVESLMTGDMQNLHEVLIKAEEAQLSLQLTVQVVNKVIQAYQEISRMQI